MYFYFLSQELGFHSKSQVPKDFHSGKVFSDAGFKACVLIYIFGTKANGIYTILLSLVNRPLVVKGLGDDR